MISTIFRPALRNVPWPRRRRWSARGPAPHPNPDKITRAEEFCSAACDEIVPARLPPGAALDETDIARRFNVSRTAGPRGVRQLAAAVSGGTRRIAARCGAALDRAADRDVRGMAELEARARALRGAHACHRAARLEAVHEELRVLSYAAIRTVSRSQRALSQRDLCRSQNGISPK